MTRFHRPWEHVVIPILYSISKCPYMRTFVVNVKNKIKQFLFFTFLLFFFVLFLLVGLLASPS